MRNKLGFGFVFSLALGISAMVATFQPQISEAGVINDSSALFVFGDSLSDTGNMFAASGGTVPPPVTYRNGRFSNGPIWIDRVGRNAGKPLSAVTAVSAPTADGVNFAFGGATSGSINVFGAGLPGLIQQVGMFHGLAGNGLIAPNADALFIVWAGANDYLGGGVVDPTIPVGNIAGAISDLHALGGRRFLVPNLPDLGITPLGAAIDPVGLSTLTDFHNAGLALALGNLSASLSGIEISGLDIHQAFNQALADPAAFGFSNTAVPCLDATITGVPTGACPDAASFGSNGALFWDPLHPTSEAHRLLANLATVPEPAALPLFGIGLAGLGLLRRRSSSPRPIFSLAAAVRRRSARYCEAGAALALLIYLSPCLVAIASAVRLSGPGPFFVKRPVRSADGRLVNLYRFSTEAHPGGNRWQSNLSRFVRSTRIDTLPGLFNVMRGDIGLKTVVTLAT